jgi:trans-2,3-dihydro-3-hydroxyanthranilate isomerase
MGLAYDGAMAGRIAFTLVDVFSSRPFRGNQLAVFHDARGLKTAQMQTLAREMNFSESTFVIPAPRRAAPVRVRIFTPRREIPMAGHPTIGTAWVLASHGVLRVGEATLRLGVGDLMVSIEGEARNPAFIWMSHRPAEFGERWSDLDRIAAGLGIDAVDVRRDLPIEAVSTGNPFLLIPLTSIEALERCVSSPSALGKLFEGASRMLPVYLFVCEDSPTPSVRARMFAPHTDGIAEDPATGSAAAPLGAYLRAHGVIGSAARSRFQIIQGVEMGRHSDITVEVLNTTGDGPSIRIGGRCAIVGEGQMRL